MQDKAHKEAEIIMLKKAARLGKLDKTPYVLDNIIRDIAQNPRKSYQEKLPQNLQKDKH